MLCQDAKTLNPRSLLLRLRRVSASGCGDSISRAATAYTTLGRWEVGSARRRRRWRWRWRWDRPLAQWLLLFDSSCPRPVVARTTNVGGHWWAMGSGRGGGPCPVWCHGRERGARLSLWSRGAVERALVPSSAQLSPATHPPQTPGNPVSFPASSSEEKGAICFFRAEIAPRGREDVEYRTRIARDD
ncbi:hypothetical protein B0T19DRAFT_76298 [Cercophora scortea]|uniref:Uncharacterized protein n=1 Tax=Cercophora scortea TaxID=314031 RepID=A0AAE0MM20_9PEZI|nr:hypothetical protein B0T19DRAFT_76298 [Cercophora scortea]